MTFTALRARFPCADRCIHLNHAGVSPIPRDVAEAVQEVLDDGLEGDSNAAWVKHLRRQSRLRQIASRLMNVPENSVGLVKNTSHGLTIAAQAIPFAPGDSIVGCATDYPSNLYPWQAQAWRGVQTRLVAPGIDGFYDEDALLRACDETTRALAVSWVQWGTGQRLDLTRLGAACQARGIWLVADIVQGLGALRPDLSMVDIAAAGCHKWLLAPSGIGLLYVRPERLPQLLPTNVGWNSVDDPYNWDAPDFSRLRTTAERFEEGSPGTLATAAFLASLSLLEATGFDAVEARVLELAAFTIKGLERRGMRVVARPGQSGIASFTHPHLANDDVEAALRQAGVRLAVRAGVVRLSPHAYSTEEEIQQAIEAIPA